MENAAGQFTGRREGIPLMRWSEKDYQEKLKRLKTQAEPKVTTHVIEKSTKNPQKPQATKILLAEIKQAGLPDPEPEYRFHPERKWRMDLAFVDQKIAVEVHGAVYANGRHTRGHGFENDREKMNEAQIMGWTVLEYSTGQVMDGTPILDLKRLLA
jgi:very-short-patch-repair endonuclease